MERLVDRRAEPSGRGKDLQGLRILVVEDEYLLAVEITAVIEELGGKVVGPVGRLAAARETARREPLDGAISDVNLDSDIVTPLTDDLRTRGVPVILTTGFEARSLPEQLKDLPCLHKPLDKQALRRLMTAVFRQSPTRP